MEDSFFAEWKFEQSTLQNRITNIIIVGVFIIFKAACICVNAKVLIMVCFCDRYLLPSNWITPTDSLENELNEDVGLEWLGKETWSG